MKPLAELFIMKMLDAYMIKLSREVANVRPCGYIKKAGLQHRPRRKTIKNISISEKL